MTQSLALSRTFDGESAALDWRRELGLEFLAYMFHGAISKGSCVVFVMVSFFMQLVMVLLQLCNSQLVIVSAPSLF